jgi:hypothetical protein
MAVPNCQAGLGKMAQPPIWVSSGFYRKGRIRKLAHARESLMEWGCLRAWEFLLRGWAVILTDSQNGDIIVLSVVSLPGLKYAQKGGKVHFRLCL